MRSGRVISEGLGDVIEGKKKVVEEVVEEEDIVEIEKEVYMKNKEELVEKEKNKKRRGER
jgi:hypothetical protein